MTQDPAVLQALQQMMLAASSIVLDVMMGVLVLCAVLWVASELLLGAWPSDDRRYLVTHKDGSELKLRPKPEPEALCPSGKHVRHHPGQFRHSCKECQEHLRLADAPKPGDLGAGPVVRAMESLPVVSAQPVEEPVENELDLDRIMRAEEQPDAPSYTCPYCKTPTCKQAPDFGVDHGRTLYVQCSQCIRVYSIDFVVEHERMEAAVDFPHETEDRWMRGDEVWVQVAVAILQKWSLHYLWGLKGFRPGGSIDSVRLEHEKPANQAEHDDQLFAVKVGVLVYVGRSLPDAVKEALWGTKPHRGPCFECGQWPDGHPYDYIPHGSGLEIPITCERWQPKPAHCYPSVERLRRDVEARSWR